MTVALYVPGDRPDRFAKAVASGADIVILDLEDAVAHDRKARARQAVVAFLEERGAAGLQVRIGGLEDLESLAAHDVELRVPKVRGPEDLDAVVDRLGAARRLHAIVEDAAGIGQLEEIAAHPAVVSVALGESDLRSDLGASSPAMLEHLRIRLVLAVRAAGLPAPLMSVYSAIADLEGLEADSRSGAALGFGGRTAVHPAQIAPIRRAFAPSAGEVAWAEEVLAALDSAAGVTTLADGQMVDEAMRRRAERILARR
ncbi:CoA ester lyase [Agrococcus sediminis]|uniref:CoA ester lyase n=1 Tax=Agrococcus sediminis TaxID=2599924 RepID=A0A5M8Q5T7_9MICO|nr:CoA ester lyase [Agrococcus sediminis]KAA6431229.1 CoA ester lyase [Agrococcus sediminis]